MSDEITIHTNLYGDLALKTLEKMFKLMKRSYVGTSKTTHTANCSEVCKATTGEVVIKVERYYDYGFSGFRDESDDGCRKYIANFIKGMTKAYLMCGLTPQGRAQGQATAFANVGTDEWRRDNMEIMPLIEENSGEPHIATISHMYFIYEFLKGRRGLEDKYDPKVVKDCVGEAYDPIRIELENAKIEEEKRLREEYAARQREIRETITAKDMEIEAKREQLRRELSEFERAAYGKMNDLEGEMNVAIESMRKKFDDMIAAAFAA